MSKLSKNKITARICDMEFTGMVWGEENEDENIIPEMVFIDRRNNALPGRFITEAHLYGEVTIPEKVNDHFLDEKIRAVIRHNFEQSGWEQKAMQLGLKNMKIKVTNDFDKSQETKEKKAYYTICLIDEVIEPVLEE